MHSHLIPAVSLTLLHFDHVSICADNTVTTQTNYNHTHFTKHQVSELPSNFCMVCANYTFLGWPCPAPIPTVSVSLRLEDTYVTVLINFARHSGAGRANEIHCIMRQNILLGSAIFYWSI